MTTSTPTYRAAYRDANRDKERMWQANWQRKARAAEAARLSAMGLDAIGGEKTVTFAGYLSGLCEDAERNCLDFAGAKMDKGQTRDMIVGGIAPYGLVIRCKSGLFVVTGRRLEPLPEGVEWRQTC